MGRPDSANGGAGGDISIKAIDDEDAPDVVGI